MAEPGGQATGGQDTGRPDAGDPFTNVLVGFARELRAAGLTVGTGDVLSYFAAMTPLDPTDLVDLYWAGHPPCSAGTRTSPSTTGCSGSTSSARTRRPAAS